MWNCSYGWFRWDFPLSARPVRDALIRTVIVDDNDNRNVHTGIIQTQILVAGSSAVAAAKGDRTAAFGDKESERFEPNSFGELLKEGRRWDRGSGGGQSGVDVESRGELDELMRHVFRDIDSMIGLGVVSLEPRITSSGFQNRSEGASKGRAGFTVVVLVVGAKGLQTQE